MTAGAPGTVRESSGPMAMARRQLAIASDDAGKEKVIAAFAERA